MSTQYGEPQLLTKLVHQWLLNHSFPARISYTPKIAHLLIHARHYADVIRLASEVVSIVVYRQRFDDCRVKVDFIWPYDTFWLNHDDPDFFDELGQILEVGADFGVRWEGLILN